MNAFKEKSMKHLKKILVALVLVAVIVSSVITVVLAEEYSGDVESAQDIYVTYENAEAKDGLSLDDAKSKALAKLYSYMTNNPINPSEKGYEELVANYNQAVAKVAYAYFYPCVAENLTDAKKADAMASLFTHLSAAPLYKADDVGIPTAYACRNHSQNHTVIVLDFYEDVPLKGTCPDGCEKGTEKFDAWYTLKFSDLLKEIHNLNIEITDLVVNRFFEKVDDASQKANYYEMFAAKEALANYIAEYLDLPVGLPESIAYTGTLASIQTKMSVLSENSTYEELKTGLAEIYSYLVLNPVSPAEENYYSFYTTYNALCDALMARFEEKINSAASANEKAAIFADMCLYLSGAEDKEETTEVDETVAPSFVSQRAALRYNELREALVNAYEGMVGGVDSLVEFDEAVPVIEYSEDSEAILSTLNSRLDRCLSDMTKMENRFKTQIYNYLKKDENSKLDPTAPGYAVAMEKYNLIAGKIIDKYADSVRNASALEGKYDNLVLYYNFLKTYPMSNEAISVYNQLREEVRSDYQSFYDDLNAALPVYVPYTEVDGIKDVSALKDLLSDVENAYNAYISAGDGEKPAALETLKSTIITAYRTYAATVISPTAEGVKEFAEEYNALCLSFINILLTDIDAQEDIELKAAGLANVKAILTAYPLSKASLTIYNAKVAEVFAGNDVKIAAEKLTSVYHRADELMNAMNLVPATIPALQTALSNAASDLANKQALFDTDNAAVVEAKAKLAALEAELAILEAADPIDAVAIENKRTEIANKQIEIQNLTQSLETSSGALAISREAHTVAKNNLNTVYTEFYNNAKELKAIYSEIYSTSKVYDPAYFEFMYAYSHKVDESTPSSLTEGIVIAIKDVIVLDVNNAINSGDNVYAIQRVGELSQILEEINCKEAIDAFEYQINLKSRDLQMYIRYITGEEVSDQIAIIDSPFAPVSRLIAQYKAAETYESKVAKFKELYVAFPSLYTTIYMFDNDYTAVKSEYDNICTEFANLMIATLNASSDLKVQYDALLAVRDFLTAEESKYHYSTAISEAYNLKRTELQASNISDDYNIIKDGTKDAVYASLGGTLADFTDFGTILNGSDIDVEELKSYYNKLTGKKTGILPVDFTNSGFDSVIKEYSDAMDAYLAYLDGEYKSALADCEAQKKLAEKTHEKDLVAQYVAKVAAEDVMVERLLKMLSKAKLDFSEISATSKIAGAYKTARNYLVDYQNERVRTTFSKYKTLVAEIHEYVSICKPNDLLLTDASKAQQNLTKTKLEVAEYAEALAYVDDFDNAAGKVPAMIKKQAYTNLSRYNNLHGLEKGYSEKLLADVLLLDMFEVLMADFNAILDANYPETTQARADAIEDFAYFMEYKNFPQSLVDAFKIKYPTAQITVTPAVSTGTTGKFGVFAEYSKDFYAAKGVNEMKEKLAAIVAYINSNPMDSRDLNDDVTKALERMAKDLEVAIAEQKELLQKDTNFNDYSAPYQMKYDMEDGKAYVMKPDSGNDDKGTTISVKTDDNGNRYANVNHSTNNTAYFNVWLKSVNTESTFVVEFDLMSPDPGSDFYVNFTEYGVTNGTRGSVSVIRFTDGKLDYAYDYYNKEKGHEFPNYKKGVDEPIELIPGQWMHVIYIIDPVKFEMELIIDYISLGKKPIVFTDPTDTCTFNEMRFQTRGTSYAYDNLLVYTGSGYRDPNRFKGMSNEDLLKFYVDYVADDTNLTVNRIGAYYAAADIVANSTNEEYKEKFNNLSVDDILQSAQLYYQSSLESLAAPLEGAVITSNNYVQYQNTIKSIQSYVKSNQAYMDQSADWFARINNLILDAEEKIVWAQNLMDYVEILPLFQRAPSLVSLKKYYAEADKYYKICMLDDPVYLDRANNDDSVKAIIDELYKMDSSLETAISGNIGTYHTVYMQERMKTQKYLENSKKLVECIAAIKLLVNDDGTLTPEQYREKLVEVATAKENIDYVNAYMIAMRDVVISKEYNKSYPNIDDALVIYGLLDTNLYTIVQEAHYALIEEQFARYKQTNSYIERAGICTYVENYIRDNNVDILSQRGTLLNYTLSVYKQELIPYKSEYEAILAANTNLFISIVDRMKAYTEYGDLKPLYDDAIENYYYNMNVDSEQAKSAIETFAIYEKMIEDCELSSKLFLDYADNLKKAMRPAQTFRALANCSKYIDFASEDVEGVSDAIKLYNEKLAAYNESIGKSNSEVSAAVDVVCSVRVSSIPAAVLAAIKNVFVK